VIDMPPATAVHPAVPTAASASSEPATTKAKPSTVNKPESKDEASGSDEDEGDDESDGEEKTPKRRRTASGSASPSKVQSTRYASHPFRTSQTNALGSAPYASVVGERQSDTAAVTGGVSSSSLLT